MPLRHAEPDCFASLEPLRVRLLDTVTWCVSHASEHDVAGCLRSPELRPRVLESGYVRSVQSVASARETRVRSRRLPVGAASGGRLLVYFPDSDLSDGAAEAESRGFFDIHNAPPWDTWVGFFSDDVSDDDSHRNYLLAYVPPTFAGLAAAGIAVNPEACIVWLEDSEVGLLERWPHVASLLEPG